MQQPILEATVEECHGHERQSHECAVSQAGPQCRGAPRCLCHTMPRLFVDKARVHQPVVLPAQLVGLVALRGGGTLRFTLLDGLPRGNSDADELHPLHRRHVRQRDAQPGGGCGHQVHRLPPGCLPLCRDRGATFEGGLIMVGRQCRNRSIRRRPCTLQLISQGWCTTAAAASGQLCSLLPCRHDCCHRCHVFGCWIVVHS
mmetsp:Transcript_16316/g.48924  ORF Transcript_16316/g.48924 Transcript_16316/m.48924 type:complete len:201 (+) Transcript_16316:973-1575(+)